LRPGSAYPVTLALGALLTARTYAEVPQFARESEWVEVRSPHLIVITDAGLGPGRATVDKLERYAEALGRLNAGLRANPAVPATVIVFRDQSEFAQYVPPGTEDAVAFFRPGDDRDRLVISASSPGESAASSVFHEFVHYLLAANFPAVPLWLNEGLAMYYSTCRLHPTYAEFGQPDLPPARWMRSHRLISIEMMFAMNTAAAAYRRYNETQFVFYAESYLLTHYLQSTPAVTGHLDAYLLRLRRGARPMPAFHEEFPDSVWQPIATALEGYPDQIEFQALRTVPVGPPPDETERTLTPAEALTSLGELMVTGNPMEDSAAAEHFHAALAVSPSYALATAWLGLIAELAGHTAEAEADYARALATGDTTPAVLDVVARGKLWRMQSESGESASVDSMRMLATAALELYRRALRVDGADIEALGGRGVALYALGDASDSTAVEGLARAVDGRPRREDMAVALAELRALQGRTREAVDLLRHRVVPIVPPSRVESVNRRAVELESGAANDRKP